ncbi:SDR family NAD(P)-dependent oxidoreductase [Telluribacter humicola]|uniref:SDR family NAD(P)-dependent oxidoreductase n=1 Tax=Telluribacter humicola TaxID=1720261 RepID=UPI001A96BC1C|nr:SDR family oxidoreductase [Telluribacter humicola]
MEVQNKTIVVTGGGSGMGREIVLHLLSKGASVVAIDINEATLKETVALANHSQSLSTFAVDITNKASVEKLLGDIFDQVGAVDGIINNAGIIQPFIKVDQLGYEAIERVFNVNFYGTLYMTKTFLPHLLTRPEAHIVNVSSMGGFLPVPGQTIYGASKAAVKLFTEGLHSELADTWVHVTIVFPGAVSTNITQNSGASTPHRSTSNSKSMKVLSADKAAEIIIEGMEQNRYRVLVGNDAKMMDLYYRFNPASAARMIAQKMKSVSAI